MPLPSLPPKWPQTFPSANPDLTNVLKDVLRWMWQDLVRVLNNQSTYTPAQTSGVNITSSVFHLASWMQFAQLVTVQFSVDVTVAAAGLFEVDFNLPVPTTFANATDLSGVAASSSGLVASLSADTTNNVARLQGTASAAGTFTLSGSFSYRVR